VDLTIEGDVAAVDAHTQAVIERLSAAIGVEDLGAALRLRFITGAAPRVR
jgi:hypothetical protein